jgi:hypothetical protein
MPWTTPVALGSGDPITAADWDTNTVDNVTFAARMPAAYASMSSSQSIASNTLTTYTTVQVNNLQVGGSGDDPTLTAYQLVCQTTGLYRITAKVTFPANATGQRVLRLKHEGAVLDYDIKQATAVNGGAGALQNTVLLATALQTVTATDVVDCEVAQDSGSSLSIQGNCFLMMEMLRIS